MTDSKTTDKDMPKWVQEFIRQRDEIIEILLILIGETKIFPKVPISFALVILVSSCTGNRSTSEPDKPI